MNSQKLKEVIGAYGPALGMTEDGKVWALKALHPSDPLTDVRGVPDQSCGATTVLNWQQQATISTPGDGTKTWEADVYFFSDPTVFATVYARTTDGESATPAYNVFNQALSQANLAGAATAMMTDFQRWRMAYAGLTIYGDGPALANQGTISAAQYVPTPYLTPGPTDPIGALGAPWPYGIVPSMGCAFADDAIPTYDLVQSMPNAYIGQAKDGCYMPLRHDSNHSVWHDHRDYVTNTSAWNSLVSAGARSSKAKSCQSGLSSPDPSSTAVEVVVPTTRTGVCPLYPSCAGLIFDSNSETFSGARHLMPCSSYVGALCFRNMSSQMSLALQFRMGFECQVLPGSKYAPYLHLSPPYDTEAIANYFRISRELKDAYPAEFNDLGKLWDVIKKAATVVSPIVRMLPGGNLITAAGSMVGNAIDASMTTRTNKRDKLPAAVLERAQQQASTKSRTKTAIKVRPRKK